VKRPFAPLVPVATMIVIGCQRSGVRIWKWCREELVGSPLSTVADMRGWLSAGSFCAGLFLACLSCHDLS